MHTNNTSAISIHVLLAATLTIFVILHFSSAGGQEASTILQSKNFSHDEFGISFTIPKGINIYTPETPGPLGNQLSQKVPFIFVNPAFTEENINVRVAQGVSEDDVIKFKILIEAESYRAPLPEYRRISVNVARIGKLKSKTAIDHLFNAKGNIYGTLRQVTFSHRGRGFIFTCATSVDRFDTANRQFFEALFDSMEFR